MSDDEFIRGLRPDTVIVDAADGRAPRREAIIRRPDGSTYLYTWPAGGDQPVMVGGDELLVELGP